MSARAAVVLAAALAAAAAAQDAPAPDYFPHAQGARWEYRRTFRGDVKDVVVEVTAVESREGRTLATVSDAGEYLGFERTMEFTAAGVGYPPAKDNPIRPVPLLRYPLKAGDTFDSLLPAGCGFSAAKATVDGPEEVAVPAGRFMAVKVTYAGRVFNTPVTMPVWYAPGVGVVKQVYGPAGSNIVIELVKYTPGK